MSKVAAKKHVPSTTTITVESTIKVDLSRYQERLAAMIKELRGIRGEIEESEAYLEEALDRASDIELKAKEL